MSGALRLGQALACVWVVLLGAAAWAAEARAAEGVPERYRDFKIYTTSAAHEQDAARMVATALLRNEGRKPLEVRARLEANDHAGFRGSTFSQTIAPGAEAKWTYELRPPEGFEREVLTGTIAFGPQGARPDRDLMVAVQGADPADFNDRRVEPISERARVVATYAPRSRAAVRASYEAAEARRRAGPRLTIAREGRSEYRIALALLPAAGADGQAPTFEQWAADEARTAPERELIDAVRDLQRVIEVQSGAKLPIVAAAPGVGPAILITPRRPDEALDLPHVDAYTLVTEGRDLVIKAQGPDGLRHGIYGLLTDHLDAHWFLSRGLGEEIVVPADRTVSVRAELADAQSPSWFSVSGMSWGDTGLWDRRNRSLINRGRFHFGHSWNTYMLPNQYPFEEFHDMWARDREDKIRVAGSAGNNTNFCSTSPEVIELVARKVNERFDADPNAIIQSLDPNDYAPMCLCDRCLALDKQYGQVREDGREVADRLIHFANEIHDRLKPEHKDKYLGILAYGHQMELPISAKPSADYYVSLICNFPPRYDHTRPFNDPTSEKNRDFLRLVEGWGAMSTHFGYYDYYGHYYYFGPMGVIQKMREDLPAFHELGGTYLMIEAQPNFGMHGINLYTASRLAWDKDADVDVLLEGFFTKLYGPAADPMREFWLGAERLVALTRPGTHADRAANEPAFWEELDGYLRQAEAITATLGPTQRRFADRVMFHRDAFNQGRAMWEFGLKYAPRRGPAHDLEGALARLREAKPRLEALRAKYPEGDEYWPTLIRPLFLPDIDSMIERLERDGQLRPQ